MATILSAQAGNWKDGSTWIGGVAPGLPDIADIRHKVTVSDEQACTYANIGGGTGWLDLLAAADLTLRDISSSRISLSTTGAGLTAAPGAVIRSSSAVPASPWRLIITPKDAENRTLVLDGLECLGIAPRITWSAAAMGFNNDAAADVKFTLTAVSPRSRTPVLDYHRIAGRNAGGRTFCRGNDSARITATGFCPDSAKNRSSLEALKDVGVVSFTSWRTHMARGYVEDVRLRQPAGSMYLYYDIYLVEDL